MTDSLFAELVREDLGVEISVRLLRKAKPRFKSYRGKMSEFNYTVFFDQDLYIEFLNTLKSNTQCQN